jgi:hypothetical protein
MGVGGGAEVWTYCHLPSPLRLASHPLFLVAINDCERVTVWDSSHLFHFLS